jgi:hypothetical protein
LKIFNFYFIFTKKEEEYKEISDEEDWQFVTIGDQVNILKRFNFKL